MENNKSATSVNTYLTHYSSRIDPLIDNFFRKKIKQAAAAGSIPQRLLEKTLQLVRKGKKIRGAFVVLGYQIAGGKDLDSIYQTSLFIELWQTGALIHDDIMDHADKRRGIPTIHKQFEQYGTEIGTSIGICAGDIAFYLSWNQLISSNFDPEKRLKAAEIYLQYALDVFYGQTLDLTIPFNKDPDDDLLKVIKYKTAGYTGCLPLLVGATLGGMKEVGKLKSIEEFGLALGYIFQIKDDILGLFGDEKVIGKSTISDLKEGKMTILIRSCLDRVDQKKKKYITSLLGNPHVQIEDVKKIKEICVSSGAYDFVFKRCEKFLMEGKKLILSITTDKYLQNLLESFLIFALHRNR